VREHGGRLIVEPFTLPGIGHGCYITDPAGVLIGLHADDPEARSERSANFKERRLPFWHGRIPGAPGGRRPS
jgi:hypothetical protein